MKILAQIDSDKDTTIYEIRVGEDFQTYCTCPAWPFSKIVPKKCKHLERFMCGEFDFIGNKKVSDVDNKDGFSIRAILLD